MEVITLNKEIIQNDEISKSLINPATAYLSTLMAKNSRTKMAAVLNKVSRELGYIDLHNCPWEQMRRHHVQAIITKLSDKGRAPATINICLSALKGVAEQAWASGQIGINEYEQIKRVKGARGSRTPKGRALSKIELQKLIDTVESDTRCVGLRDTAILGILISCGLRRSEVVALNYSSIDFINQSISFIGKGNKQRICFLPNSTMQRINTWIEEVRGTEEGPLFTRIRRHDDFTMDRLTDQAIYYILSQRGKEASIDNFSPHDLRRTFVTMLIASGKDMLTVRDAAGHASVTTTERYNRAGDERLREASNLFDF